MRTKLVEVHHYLDLEYRGTQGLYDKNPPNNDLVPTVSALNASPFVSISYLGIEKMLLFLISTGKEQGRQIGRKARSSTRHSLKPLFQRLPKKERDILSTRYRSAWSLFNKGCYNFNLHSGDPEEERELSKKFNDQHEEYISQFSTLDKFFAVSGDGYNKWRYFLVDPKSQSESTMEAPKIPSVNVDLMLEVWRSLVWLSACWLKEAGEETGPTINTMPIEIFLNEYIMGHFYRTAQDNDEWQAATQDDNYDVRFRDLHDWFRERPSVSATGVPLLISGLELLNFNAGKTPSLPGACGLLKRVLTNAADKGLRTPLHASQERLSDIRVFHQRIGFSGLEWDSEKREFNSLARKILE